MKSKQTIVLASSNKHKNLEIKEILKDYEILPMKEVGFFDDIEENGKDSFENSLIKAKAIGNYLKSIGKNYMVLADDSGLCVNALNGEPGIYSARYAGDHNDEANRQKVLSKLEGKRDRSAYFICAMVLLNNNDEYIYAEGKTYGQILHSKKGDESFGYDCIFESADYGKSFGECTEEEKNSVSHRFRALQNLLEKLQKNAWEKL